MSDITAETIQRAFDNWKRTTGQRLQTFSGQMVHDVSYHSMGRMAGQMVCQGTDKGFEISSKAFYWKWWLNGRPPVYPKHAKFLRWYSHGLGRYVFAKSAGAFEGHRSRAEQYMETGIGHIADQQLDRWFNGL